MEFLRITFRFCRLHICKFHFWSNFWSSYITTKSTADSSGEETAANQQSAAPAGLRQHSSAAARSREKKPEVDKKEESFIAVFFHIPYEYSILVFMGGCQMQRMRSHLILSLINVKKSFGSFCPVKKSYYYR